MASVTVGPLLFSLKPVRQLSDGCKVLFGPRYTLLAETMLLNLGATFSDQK